MEGKTIFESTVNGLKVEAWFASPGVYNVQVSDSEHRLKFGKSDPAAVLGLAAKVNADPKVGAALREAVSALRKAGANVKDAAETKATTKAKGKATAPDKAALLAALAELLGK